MKVDKLVFEAYSREISTELSVYNTEQCKIKQDKIREDYYQTPEGCIIKAVQEINTPTPLINPVALNSRMKLTSLSNFQSSVIYNKLIVFSVKTNDYEELKELVFTHYKEKIDKFYE